MHQDRDPMNERMTNSIDVGDEGLVRCGGWPENILVDTWLSPQPIHPKNEKAQRYAVMLFT
ncbi:hypothetical protein BK659_09580 [Pseudomonas brassicacearum]|uniref:Uncharacterized protein n=2 Tax=Pseudomonas brassicacearum TaxID=930166 RepID=A0A423HAC8_9PSED|nr:hypothetical protein BK659_09580 [Pseudomonas brassicacearum]